MKVLGVWLGIAFLAFSIMQVYAQESPSQFTLTTDTPSPEAAPLDIFISITSPDTLGLYVENKPITLLIEIKNIGDNPLHVSATGKLTKLSDERFNSEIFGAEDTIPSNGTIVSQTSRILDAGTYSLLLFASASEYQSRVAEFVFTISTTQDLLIRQQTIFAEEQARSAAESAEIARLSLYVAIISVIAGVGTAIAAILVNKKSSDRSSL